MRTIVECADCVTRCKCIFYVSTMIFLFECVREYKLRFYDTIYLVLTVFSLCIIILCVL